MSAASETVVVTSPQTVDSLTHVAVIGTSGGTMMAGSQRLTSEHFEFIKESVLAVLKNDFKLDPMRVRLISGGSSWSDHAAVQLFLEKKVKALTLHTPCALSADGFGYDRFSNTGVILNARHRNFGDTIGQNTLGQLTEAVLKGAKVEVTSGYFQRRNTKIATSCSFLIAYTFGDHKPTSSGTLDTWTKCPAAVKKRHISLSRSAKKWTLADYFPKSRVVETESKQSGE